jgi:hypothetical protein
MFRILFAYHEGTGSLLLVQGGTTRFAKLQRVEGLGALAECGPTHTNTHRSVGDSRRKVQAETFADFSGLRRRGFAGRIACHQI